MATTNDRPIYECTGCGTVTRNPAKQLELYRQAGGQSCCPERNMVELRAILAQPVADGQGGLAEALRDLSWAVRRSPSCQDDIVSRCRCMRCALVRADAALSAQGDDT